VVKYEAGSLEYWSGRRSMNRKWFSLEFTYAFILLTLTGFVSADQQQPAFESMAEKRTELMKVSLSLNNEQVTRIEKINLDAAQRIQELKDKNSRYKRIIFRKIQQVKKERDIELKKVLTNEQWQTYQAKKEELRSEVRLQTKELGSK
jgi:hypothetical protein